MRFTDKTLADNQSYVVDFEATRNSKTNKCTLLILRHRYCSDCSTAECDTCGGGRGMDSGELAQDLCLRAPPSLSLCRCLNLLHSSNLHNENISTWA